MAKKKNKGIAAPLSDEKRWQAEEDLRTLERVVDIENSPARLKAAKKMLAKQKKALQDVSKKL